MTFDPTRRRILQIVSTVSVVSLAGCGNSEDSDPSNGETTTSTNTTTPAATLSPTSPTATPDVPFSPPESEETEEEAPTPSNPPGPEGIDTETPTPTPTSTESEQPQLRTETAESEAFFGQTVAVSAEGTTAFVGAHRADTRSGEDSGAVYVFEHNNGDWTLETVLQPESGAEAFFGSSLATTEDGNTVLIGADGDDTTANFAGAAYLFTRSDGSWTQQIKLSLNDGSVGDRFGSAAALDNTGTTAAIAAEDEETGEDLFGAVYIFELMGGEATQQQKLTGKEGASEQFGGDVALSGDGTTLLVGDENEEGSQGESVGAAYVFTRENEGWQQSRLPHDGGVFDRFGNAVALNDSGTTAVVTAWNQADFAGAAYVFKRNTGAWRQQAEIVPDDIEQQDWFGTSVAVTATGKTALIGSYRDTTPAGETGSTYVFTQSDGEWAENKKIVPDQVDADDEFGTAVALSDEGDTSVVGAPQDEVQNTSNAGTAYVFNLSN